MNALLDSCYRKFHSLPLLRSILILTLNLLLPSDQEFCKPAGELSYTISYLIAIDDENPLCLMIVFVNEDHPTTRYERVMGGLGPEEVAEHLYERSEWDGPDSAAEYHVSSNPKVATYLSVLLTLASPNSACLYSNSSMSTKVPSNLQNLSPSPFSTRSTTLLKECNALTRTLPANQRQTRLIKVISTQTNCFIVYNSARDCAFIPVSRKPPRSPPLLAFLRS